MLNRKRAFRLAKRMRFMALSFYPYPCFKGSRGIFTSTPVQFLLIWSIRIQLLGSKTMRKVIAQHELPSQEEILSWMHALCSGPHRLAGTTAGLQAEDLIEGWFRELGLQGVIREPIPIQAWEPEEARFQCGDLTFPAYPIARSTFTAREGIRGPLVYIGVGEPDALEGRDLAGKIVVAEVPFGLRPYQFHRKTAHAVHDPGGTLTREPDTRATWILPTFARAYSWSVARGAAGFIGILKDLRANRCRYHYPYANSMEILPLPGIFIGRDDGARLLELLQGDPREGLLVAPGATRESKTDNILGFLPGTSDGMVLVTCHHDTPFQGFVQDASGLAQVLAIAQYFARRKPSERLLSLMFLASSGYFVGSMGARDFLARHSHDLKPRILLTLTLEHIAREVEERGGDLALTGEVEPRGVFVTDRPELLDLTTLAIVGNDLRRSFIAPVPEEGARVDGEAEPYFSAGLPGITCISGPEYVLTDEDKIELAASDELVPVAKTFIEIIEAFMRLVGQ